MSIFYHRVIRLNMIVQILISTKEASLSEKSDMFRLVLHSHIIIHTNYLGVIISRLCSDWSPLRYLNGAGQCPYVMRWRASMVGRLGCLHIFG